MELLRFSRELRKEAIGIRVNFLFKSNDESGRNSYYENNLFSYCSFDVKAPNFIFTRTATDTIIIVTST